MSKLADSTASVAVLSFKEPLDQWRSKLQFGGCCKTKNIRTLKLSFRQNHKHLADLAPDYGNGCKEDV